MRTDVLGSTETLGEAIAHAVERYADAPALIDDERVTTFAQLGGRVAATIRAPELARLRPGARVIIALANSPEVRVLEFAVLVAGLVRVPLSARLTAHEIAGVARDCDAALVVVEPEAVAAVLRAARAVGSAAVVTDAEFVARTVGAARAFPEPRSVAPDDEAVLLYSSGTTGAPKGACHDHRSWLAHVAMSLNALPPIGPGDIVLAAAPLSHFAGTIASDAALAGAALATTRDTSGAGIANRVRATSATILPLVPVLVTRLARELTATRGGLPTLRAVPYGGATIDIADRAQAAAVLPGVLIQFYGLAEVLAPVTALSAADHDRAAALPAEEAAALVASCGVPVPGAEVRIVDGRVQARSPALFRGYLGRPDLTDAAMTADGWFDTADLGSVTDGWLTVVGRRDDVITTGGYAVQPAEVEVVLRSHPRVLDACVIGVPDAQWGATVAAAVTLRDPAIPADLASSLLALCRSRLAGYKKPRRILVVDALPLTPVGKIDRRAVQARLITTPETE